MISGQLHNQTLHSAWASCRLRHLSFFRARQDGSAIRASYSVQADTGVKLNSGLPSVDAPGWRYSSPMHTVGRQEESRAGDQQSALNSSEQMEVDKELERRRKIGEANRGKAPWNKGRRHTPETIERIKAATAKAMARPEVKARVLAGGRQPHSTSTREKIGAVLRQRAQLLREALQPQTEELLRVLAASADARLQEASRCPSALSLLSTLAWGWRRECMDGKTLLDLWEGHPDFRDSLLDRLETAARTKQHSPIHPLLRVTMYPSTEQLRDEVCSSSRRRRRGAPSKRHTAAGAVQQQQQQREEEEGLQRLKAKLARQRQRARHVIIASLLEDPAASGSGSRGGSSIASSEECKPERLPSVLSHPEVQEAVRQYYVQCVLGLPAGAAAAEAVGMAGVSVTLGELAFVEVQVTTVQHGGRQQGEQRAGEAQQPSPAPPLAKSPLHRKMYRQALQRYAAAGPDSFALLPFRVVDSSELLLGLGSNKTAARRTAAGGVPSAALVAAGAVASG